MKRPLTAVALVYVAGLLAAMLMKLPVGWLLVFSLSLSGAALVAESRRAWFLWPLIFVTG